DYAVYSFFPEVGELVVDHEKRAAKFSHANEIGLPYYYSVTFDNGIKTEFSPTERGVHLRFTYSRKGDAWLIIDGYTGQSDFEVDVEKRQVRGWVNNQRFVNNPDNFRCYFVIQFDKRPTPTLPVREGVVTLRFPAGSTVQAKAASSYISYEQAEFTLQQELGDDKTLEQTKARGQKTWNKLLGRIRVEGGTDEDIRTFYSCLFRANLFSRKFYELKPPSLTGEGSGKGQPYYYSPYDGKTYDGYMFTDNGFWDTFRSQFPLTNILHPTQQGQYMQAMLHVQQKELGWFPSWSFPGETGGMLGNHSISLFADAWAKGIRTVNPDSLLKAYAHEVFNKGPYGSANGRGCWHEYFTLGYVPFPLSHGCVSQTLEYAYDDWCAYQIAWQCGNKHYEEIFLRHLYNYRNLWDPTTHFFRARDEEGHWNDSFEGNAFDPLVWGGPYTEGNAWHYVWSVFHDIQGLINLFGSDESFIAKLDSVWLQPSTVKPGWYGYKIHEMTEMEIAGMGQYAHGNQPIQHMPYLYSYAGQPWKTQYWVRQIMRRLYNSTPDGFPGDEDQGGMSSWYVLSALGLYAVTPGTDQYVIGSPLFRKATITLEDGKQFVIEARDNSPENVYIQSATLNGHPLLKNYITYSDIVRGGHLIFQMGPQPNKQRNITKDAAPFSMSKPS
ncbi:MAG: GH92 family glycosyl hydrolase, partial [Bacteroidaceae bacterium]|nr:GH92 family glycosyl hydrolase [Bacteroidaceae bacterium]